ncbi:MAG: glycosyltransferase [Gammaproteobacteria bacterium]|nr:glycosyltransferase [Gammaproteobacteria bacterium]
MNLAPPNTISVVIPALNEQETIRGVISMARRCPSVDEVLVVNNGSTDDTAGVAAAAGARVVDEDRPGQGRALNTGYRAARNDWIIKLDADLTTLSPSLVQRLQSGVGPDVGLVKGLWHDAIDNMPMTRLMVRPAIAIMFPRLSHIRAVNSGIFLFNRSCIATGELTSGYGADLDVMLRMNSAGWKTAEVDIGEISHHPRDLQHYNKMAETLLRFLIERHEQAAQDSIVVVADSAEDIVTCCLGTVIRKLRCGGRVAAYFRQCTGYGAELLQDALDPFPTFSLLPLSRANRFNVLPGSRKTTIITSHFHHVADSGNPLVRAALLIQEGYRQRNENATLLMMPVRKNGRVATEFRPDVRVDVGPELEMVKLTQNALCTESRYAAERVTGNRDVRRAWRGQFNPETVEAFQAYDHQDISPPLVTL